MSRERKLSYAQKRCLRDAFEHNYVRCGIRSSHELGGYPRAPRQTIYSLIDLGAMQVCYVTTIGGPRNKRIYTLTEFGQNLIKWGEA